MNLKHLIINSVFSFVTLTSLHATALPSDTEQPLYVESEQVEFDEKQGLTTYSGTVLMRQGTMRIEAEKIVIHGKIDRANMVVATGGPAHFSQTPEKQTIPVTAQAKRLEYRVDQQTLILTGDAALDQEGTSLSGDKIEYDVKKAIVKAGGGTLQDGSQTRVKMVIPPKVLQPDS
ncbi:MAG: lipopolysaccharide export system protein LptA [Flavobacteriales bacterium]|jgi:lipopolysaccharide export system protein LptA